MKKAQVKPRKVEVVKEEKKVEVVKVAVSPERDQMLDRQSELLLILDFLEKNKFQDRGQIEVALSQVNQRLTEL